MIKRKPGIVVQIKKDIMVGRQRFYVMSGEDEIFVSDSYFRGSDNYSFTTKNGSAETSWEVDPKKTKKYILQQLSAFYERLEKYNFKKLTDNEKELGIIVMSGDKVMPFPLYGSENGELCLEERLSYFGLHLPSKNHSSLRINTPYADIIFGNNSVMSLPTENPRIEVLSHNDISEALDYLISSTSRYPVTQNQIESVLRSIHRFNRSPPRDSHDKRNVLG